MDNSEKKSWMIEEIPDIKGSSKLYKFVCFLNGKRKFSYQDYYLLLLTLNKKVLGEHKAKEKALNRVLDIYQDFHKGKLPEGI